MRFVVIVAGVAVVFMVAALVIQKWATKKTEEDRHEID